MMLLWDLTYSTVPSPMHGTSHHHSSLSGARYQSPPQHYIWCMVQVTTTAVYLVHGTNHHHNSISGAWYQSPPQQYIWCKVPVTTTAGYLVHGTSHHHSSISGAWYKSPPQQYIWCVVPFTTTAVYLVQGTSHHHSSIFTLVHSSSSGARYHSVTTIGVYAFSGDPYSLASPKSPTFRMPLWLNSRLDVLRSLCRIQLSWR